MLLHADRLPKWAAPHQYGRFEKLIIGALCAFFFVSWLSFFRQSIPTIHFSSISSEETLSDNPINNATLGFHKIYALALQGREDRTQPLLDAANATNLTLSVLNAVKDVDIEKIDYPKGWSERNHRGGELGCLASHVRTWNLIVASNISTALVLESDADWDLRIKGIMAPLATGVRELVDWPFNIEHHTEDPRIAPYGDSWDLVWIGHCGSNRDGNIRQYAWNDTSVPPEHREYVFDTGLSEEQHVPGTRTVFQFGRTTCSTGYAISRQGAEKLVKYFKDTDENIDIKLSSVCSSRPDMTCLSVWPQIVTSAATKSNIDHSNGEQTTTAPAEDLVRAGPALQYSARVNAHRIMDAQGYLPRRDWIAEWDTCWGNNPTKNGAWELMKLNETSGDPVNDIPKEHENEEEHERTRSNSRARK